MPAPLGSDQGECSRCRRSREGPDLHREDQLIEKINWSFPSEFVGSREQPCARHALRTKTTMDDET
jgi:hypothetical protein